VHRLIVVRHGESLWNAERRLQGHDGAGLSDRGRAQARLSAAWVAAVHPDAHLVTSDLERAVETAEAFSVALGRPAARAHELRDRDLGAWSGKAFADLQREEPDRLARWRAGADIFPEVGGESNADLVARWSTTVRSLLEALGERGVLVVVSHGGPIFWGVPDLCGLPDGVLGPPANCGISMLEWRGGVDLRAGRLLAWNQTTHLGPALRSGARS
jgi:glucosyl-3-phosphoglycerate phosphatase